MTNLKAFRRHAVDFEAVQFTGDNFDEIRDRVGHHVADGYELWNFNPIGTYLLAILGSPEAKGELWEAEAKQWKPVNVGDWIVQQDEGWLSVTNDWLVFNCIELDEEMLALIREDERPKTFEEDLKAILNKHSMENFSGTPDWILAEYLRKCLEAWDLGVRLRADWRGESTELPALIQLHKEIVQEVPLLMYDLGQRHKIGTADIRVDHEKIRTQSPIKGVVPLFDADTIDIPKEDSPATDPSMVIDAEPAASPFQRYQQKGLSENG
jgi:hypothetical protein